LESTDGDVQEELGEDKCGAISQKEQAHGFARTISLKPPVVLISIHPRKSAAYLLKLPAALLCALAV
jgi:hypothetical protein